MNYDPLLLSGDSWTSTAQRVFSSSFLQRSKYMHVWLTGDSKFCVYWWTGDLSMLRTTCAQFFLMPWGCLPPAGMIKTLYTHIFIVKMLLQGQREHTVWAITRSAMARKASVTSLHSSAQSLGCLQFSHWNSSCPLSCSIGAKKNVQNTI